MKNVLLLAHAFPPVGAAGSQRAVKLVKYLPEHGWWPTVITAPADRYLTLDAGLLADIPAGVVVHRTRTLEPSQSQTLALRPSAAPSSTPTPSPVAGVKERARRIVYWLYAHGVIPDRSLGWAPFAIAAGLRLSRRTRFDAIFATGNPYSSFLAAAALGLALRAPYVLDYRDAWTLNPYRQSESAWRNAVERRQERFALGRAAAAIFATEPMRQDYARAFPALANHFTTMTNGYDPTDFAGVTPQALPGFTITHVGKFTPYRRPDGFLRGLARFLRNEPAARASLRALFIGEADAAVSRAVAALELEDVVQIKSYLPHAEVLPYLLGSSALLLVGGGAVSEQTSKVFEYLAAARPVLALVPEDGAAAEALRSSAAPVHFAPADDEHQIEHALSRLYADAAPDQPARAAPLEYSRPYLAGRLAEVLDRCLDAQRPAPIPSRTTPAAASSPTANGRRSRSATSTQLWSRGDRAGSRSREAAT
ncbi:MAG: glycosyltransferase [Chloroflexi bacterium]|nr:glycosyltransferase [Chloroflexota bacterium]